MSQPVKLFWISYDLGLKGDYEGFYSWLDANNARECGSNTALIELSFNPNNEDPVEKLAKELKKHVKLKKEDRIYIVWRDATNGKSTTQGKFLIGDRKRAPWEGYAQYHNGISALDSDSE